MKLNEEADIAVKSYVDLIVRAAKNYNYNLEISVDIEEITCVNKEICAASATIISEIGVVVVFPDLVKNTASAAIFNVGLVNAMEQEGYSKRYIETDAKIWRGLLELNEANANRLAHYLTHKIDPVKLFYSQNKLCG